MTRSQPVALLGEAPPRVLVEPQGARANSWEDVADLSARAGIVLDGWQELILRAAMGERADRTWAAKRVGLSVPRQNGKSQLLVARALAGALLFGERKIVISAHQQDTARESFQKVQEILDADGNGWLRARIRPGGIMSALNREAIRFSNGALIQFKARTMAGGRGFSSDCLMLDEAQRLGRRAWVSINSTMSAMPNPQVWLLGTPPTPEDDGEVFASVRKAAIDGVSTAAAWLEWAADPNAPDFDPASEFTRWSANPAWNTRINHEVVQGEHESYSPDEFNLDRLGIWADESGGWQVLSAADWTACLDATSTPSGSPVLVLDVSPMSSWAGIVAGADDGAGRTHLEVTSDGRTLDYRPGVEWVVPHLRAIVARRGSLDLWIVAGSAAEALVPELTDAGVRVQVLAKADYAAACVRFVSRVAAGQVRHIGQRELTAAVAAGAKRTTADEGLWVWGRGRSSADVALLVAATAADWLVQESAYDVMDSIG